MRRTLVPLTWLAVFPIAPCGNAALAEDRPQWGQRYTRNMVSSETGLPDGFDPGQRDYRTGRLGFWVLATGTDLRVISRIRMRDPIFATPVAAKARCT